MRRYWLSIALVLFIALSLGTYYIQANGRYPEFALTKQEGDEKEAANVLLQGRFGQIPRNNLVAIGSQGSEYEIERPFLARISTYWGSEELRRLMDEHRQFMRGKRDPRSFYEDDRLLAYADVKGDYTNSGLRNSRFVVSVLDKNTGQASSYEAGVPNGNMYNQIIVNDVQVIGEQLKVTAQNYNKNGVEIHLYTLGLTSGNAPADQTLIRVSDQPNMDMNLSSGDEENMLSPSRYIVFRLSTLKRVPTEYGGYNMEETAARLLVFNIQTGQEVKIESQDINDLLKSGSKYKDLSISSQGDNLFLAKKTEEGVRTIRYNIPEAKVAVRDVQTDSVDRTIIKNGRLYMLIRNASEKRELPSLVIADAGTGNLLYKGKISLKETDLYHPDEINKLYIYDLVVK